MEFTTHFGLQSQTTRLSEDGSGPRTPPPRTGLSPSPTCLSRPTWAVAPRVQSPRPATIRWRRSARDCLLELFPLRSPLLGESSLVALPPLIDMLKFGGSPRLIWGPRTRPNDETPNAHRHRRSRRNGTTTGSPLPPRPKRGPEMGRPDRHPRRSRRIAHLGRRRPPPGSTTTRTAPKSRCRPPATTPRHVPPPPPPTGGTKTGRVRPRHTSPVDRCFREGDAQTDVPPAGPTAPFAFKDSMIHWIPQFTLRIAVRGVLHRCTNRGVHR